MIAKLEYRRKNEKLEIREQNMRGKRLSVSVRRRAAGARRGRGERRRARARAAARREARGTQRATGGQRSRAPHTWRTAPRPAAPTPSRAPAGCSPAQRHVRVYIYMYCYSHTNVLAHKRELDYVIISD